MTLRFPLAAFALTILVVPAFAEIDAEPKTPYLWRIVLKTEPHPLLSPSFREQIKRDIMAALQPELGPLGTVEVIDLSEPLRDSADPLLQQFEDKGFAALDAPRDLTGAKTHFLKIAYKDGLYHLESRQYDGFTGLASPLVRKQSERAALLVGRTAGLMLDRDFGLTASADPITLQRGQDLTELKITVRGGQLGPIDRFVKVGDVFAMSQITKTTRAAPPPLRTATGKIIAPPRGSEPPPAYTAKPRPFTLLRVVEVKKDGTLRCAVFSQLVNPAAPGREVAGYRFMKLGTVEAPVTVRLVSSKQGSVGQVNVRATELGFKAATDAKDTFDFKDGLFRSVRPLSNLACVTVSLGVAGTKFFPVPVLGPDPVNLPFELDPKVEELAAFLREVVSVSGRVDDALYAQAICFQATGLLVDKKKNTEALARAKGGFQAADTVDKTLTDEMSRLKEQAEKSPEAIRALTGISNKLSLLRSENGRLADYIKLLEPIVARENDPREAARQVQADAIKGRIAVSLSRGEVDEALNAYDQWLTLFPEDAGVKAERDKLKADWATKNPAHAKAREYLLKTWPAVANIPDFKESLPLLGREVQVCKDNNDRFALRKLLTLFNAAAVKLNELAAPLDPNSDSDRKLAEDARKVGEAMAAMEIDIRKFVDTSKK